MKLFVAFALFCATIVAVVIAMPSSASTPIPKMQKQIKQLQKQVVTLQGEITQIQIRQENQAEANDKLRHSVDINNAAIACVAAWVAPTSNDPDKTVDDLGSCNLLNLRRTPPDFQYLIQVLAKEARG